MPSIKIREIDTTSGGTVLTTQDVVYVPGFVNVAYINDANFREAYSPALCTSITEFENYFGNIPASFAEDQPYPDGFAADAKFGDILFVSGDMDPGYVYAKELLNAGLPVLYERMNETVEDISVAHMYDVLNENAEKTDIAGNKSDVRIWENLEDINEYYEVKYLTSGGYPTFEYYALGKLKPSTENVKLKSFDQAVFKTRASKATEDTIYKFVYNYEATIAISVNTFADLEYYKDKAKEDEFYYVIDEDTVYQILITDEGRSWAPKEPAWSLLKNNVLDSSAILLTSWGIAPVESTVVTTSTIIVDFRVSPYSIVASKMISCAATRGDCVALIDHTNNPLRTLDPNNTKSIYYSISNEDSNYRISTDGEFATMFTPWCGYQFNSALTNSLNKDSANLPSAMPASFGYLVALAKSIRTNVNWLAIAGASRGVVNITGPKLNGNLRLSNAIAEAYQPRNGIAINPITNIKPYGYLIWGNRTLKNNAIEGNLVATSFLNTRNMVSDIKKIAYMAAKRCMFEQNSDILWINYKARITPLLDSMVTGAGLSGYKLLKGTTTEKAKLVCTIRLYPLYAVESFDITVELADDTVTIS